MWGDAVITHFKTGSWDFPACPVVKNHPRNAGDMYWSPGKGNWYPFCWEATDSTCHQATKPEATTREFMKEKESEVSQSCLILCDPMDYSLPGSSVHGIFQTRTLEWVAISFSRRSSQPRDWTLVSRIVGRRFTVWGTREVQRVHELINKRSCMMQWRSRCHS